MPKLVISSGHGHFVRGASGYLDEVTEARRVVERVAESLRELGIEVETFHDDTSTSQNENLNTIVDYHNSQERDGDVSVHFNAYQDTTKPMGTEVLYTSQATVAALVSDAIAQAGLFIDRGAKYRDDLFFLNQTHKPAILIETCFVDSEADAELYKERFEDICQGIARCLFGLGEEEAEIEIEPEPETDLSGENAVEINGTVLGNISVIINGQIVRRGGSRNAIDLEISLRGDVYLTINGEDFHSKPAIPPNQCNITASVFGGTEDYNVSAYDENKVLNDTDLYVALPDRFEGERPMVMVHNRATGLFATAAIWDVGPWNIDDPYWESGQRPQAESGTDMSGRPTNGAGIDLSPALARAIGIDGMGTVDWQFAI